MSKTKEDLIQYRLEKQLKRLIWQNTLFQKNIGILPRVNCIILVFILYWHFLLKTK